MKELEFLISSQEEQEKKGNLTPIGISYLNGLRAAMNIVKKSNVDYVSKHIYCDCVVGKCEGREANRCAFKNVPNDSLRVLQNPDCDCIKSNDGYCCNILCKNFYPQ